MSACAGNKRQAALRKAAERIFDNIQDFSYLTKSVSVCKFTDLNRSAKRNLRVVDEVLEERKARKAQRKEKLGEEQKAVREKLAERAKASLNDVNRPLEKGDSVRIKGTNSIGEIEAIQGKQVTVIFGGLRSKVKLEQLERSEKVKVNSEKFATATDKHAHLAFQTSHMTRATMEDRRQNFHQDLDVRGMRGDEAIDTVMHFIDDAILIGLSRVRILHGTGTGILRQLIRQYLATVPNVKKAKDEHVQFGGAGITVVDLD